MMARKVMTSACNSPSVLMLGSQLPAISLVLAFNERRLVAASSPMPASASSSRDTREMILARMESWLSMRDPGGGKSATCYWCAKMVTESYPHEGRGSEPPILHTENDSDCLTAAQFSATPPVRSRN